jgi:hypothetical protein
MRELIPIGQRFVKMKTSIDKDDWRRGRDVRNEMEQYGTLGAKARDHPNLTKGFVCCEHPRQKFTGVETRQRVVLAIKVGRKATAVQLIRRHQPPHTKLI